MWSVALDNKVDVCGFISAAATEDETDLDGSQSNDDNNQSDYFADVETSSCCSFELDVGWTDAEDGKGV